MPDDERPVTKNELDAALGAALAAAVSDLRVWIAERMEALENRMLERLEAQETRFLERLEAQETRFLERLETQETRLLTAFHGFVEANHIRIQKVEVGQHLDGDRLTKLEERVRILEERLDFPNQFRQRQS